MVDQIISDQSRRSDSRSRVAFLFLVASLALGIVDLMSVGVAQAAGPIGVGIQAEPLQLATTAQPGHNYHFPTVYVINNGTQGVIARFTVEPLNKGAEHVLPASWISFPTAKVLLRPGESAHIPVSLHVPRGAATGTYLSDVVVHAISSGTSSGVSTQIAAAAATKVEFTISTKAAHSADGIPTWVLLAGIALAVFLLLFLIWRSGLRLTIKKPSP
jgi:hypothetical protein